MLRWDRGGISVGLIIDVLAVTSGLLIGTMMGFFLGLPLGLGLLAFAFCLAKILVGRVMTGQSRSILAPCSDSSTVGLSAMNTLYTLDAHTR